VLDFLYELGETFGHGPRTGIEVFPQSPPDLCSDVLHAICIFLRQQGAIAMHGVASFVIPLCSILNTLRSSMVPQNSMEFASGRSASFRCSRRIADAP
jgi:hypothetical protein